MSLSLLVTIVLMALILAVSVGLWARHHRIRPIIRGLGLMLVPLGLYLLGVMDLAINGILSLVDWAQRTAWDDIMTWGASLVAAGIVLAIIAQYLPSGPKPHQPEQRPAAGGSARPQVADRSQPAAPQTHRPAAVKSKDGLSDEDREIEELLKRRGIN